MAVVKPFKGLRPPQELVENVSCLPYDVMNSKEAAEMASGKKESLLHVTRAEIDLPEGTDTHSEIVYEKAVSNFKKMQSENWLVQDEEAKFYIYAQTMDGRTQHGIVGCAWYQDYFNEIIKKHELTRPDKEEDRMILTNYTNANIEPVFFSYKAVPEIDEIVEKIVKNQAPEYDFVADDGFGHHFWAINDAAINKRIEELFETKVPFMYVADGHHRTAGASRIGKERTENNPNATGKEECCYFMTVIFPDNQLKIIDYNRVVKDLNGHGKEEFMNMIVENFVVQDMGTDIYKPASLHEFSMYIDKHWYKLNAKPNTYNDDDPIDILDVNVLSKYILNDILGIEDLRTSQRIDFVGGIRGLGELKKRVDSDEMAVAFAMYPVSMDQLINIADSGNIMPPKTTWFEPKLRSGLAIHKLD
ncbi:MAG: DUF1015 family protein [Bacteroidales bacterium]|nr:DUF1015 family protein [Bacteroidales bacterium]MDD4216724.1 DUF1015 family protein [Bacteroidales bacterium]MDY0140430.1 DUF1015 family protein [Bacteroidales bacterium]